MGRKKNLIFDLGNVLVSFDSLSMLENLYGQKAGQKMYEVLFPELWHELDAGNISNSQLARKAKKLLPEYENQIDDWMQSWPQRVEVITANLQLVERLSKYYSIYILSDLPRETYLELEKKGVFRHALGGVYSFELHQTKPSAEMYETILQRYSLKSEECLLIDDRKENVLKALEMGMDGIILDKPQNLQKILALRGYIA